MFEYHCALRITVKLLFGDEITKTYSLKYRIKEFYTQLFLVSMLHYTQAYILFYSYIYMPSTKIHMNVIQLYLHAWHKGSHEIMLLIFVNLYISLLDVVNNVFEMYLYERLRLVTKSNSFSE